MELNILNIKPSPRGIWTVDIKAELKTNELTEFMRITRNNAFTIGEKK